MTADHWRRIEQIFDSVSDLPAGERERKLNKECGGDPHLRREVEALLQCDDGDDRLADEAVQGMAEILAEDASVNVAGKRFGAYRVTRVIGHGGMGSVYEAVRADDQYEHKAAIKVLRRGLEAPVDIRRFRRERQILARLDHPNIAHLLDGGTTPDGTPYLVLEYVEGEPVTDYCRKRSLSVPEILRLILQVAAAVQFAHQRLVVHRDLKPGNILVTTDGVPKLLDFGVALLLETDDTAEPRPRTYTTAWMLTPDYASPEQVRGEPVTAASDVYALGAVLYELLTGKGPHRLEKRHGAGMVSAVCDAPVEMPSIAAGNRALRGDLDTILLMALRKEPQRRYATIADFASDISRFLEGRPVRARKDTAFYRSGKFLRRHRWSAAAAVLAVAGLLGTTAFALRQSREAEAQRRSAETAAAAARDQARRADEARAHAISEGRRAETARAAAVKQAQRADRRFAQVRSLARTMLFDIDSRLHNVPGTLSARALLAEKAIEYFDSLAPDAQGDEALEWELAQGYERVAAFQRESEFVSARLLGIAGPASLGNDAEARRNLEKAVRIDERLLSRNPKNREYRVHLTAVYHNLGAAEPNAARAIQYIRKAIEIAREINPPFIMANGGNRSTNLFAALGLAELRGGDPRGAVARYSELRHNGFVSQVAGFGFEAMGDLDSALRVFRETMAGPRDLRRLEGTVFYREASRYLAVSLLGAAGVTGNPRTLNLGRPNEALAYCREAIPLVERLVQLEKSDVAAQRLLARAYLMEARLLQDRDSALALDAAQKALKLNATADVRAEIAYALRSLGQKEEALAELRRALEQNPVVPETAVFIHHQMGDLLGDASHYQKALSIAEKAASEKPLMAPLRKLLADSQIKMTSAAQNKTSK